MSSRTPHAPHSGATAAGSVRRVFVVTLFLNLAVALAKGLYSYFSGSIALGTDALHALLDASSNVLALFSLQWAQVPADDKHPYGRRKIEILAALGIGVLILIGLFEMAAAAVRSLLGDRAPPQIRWTGFVVVACTMAVNYVITRYEEKRGHELGSSLLCADAQHTRSDVYASIAVLLSFLGTRLGFRWADPVGAMLVVALVGRAAWIVFRDNVPTLIDTAVLDPQRVASLAAGVAGDCAVSRVRSRGMRNAVHLDLHVAVDPGMSVADAHALTEKIDRTLRQAFPELSDVTIRTGPRQQPVQAPVQELADDAPEPRQRG